MDSLNAKEKIQKNILLFQYQLKKNLIIIKKITYKLKFIDSFRFMSISLSSLVDNLSEIYKKECKGLKKNEKSNQYATLLVLKIIN